MALARLRICDRVQRAIEAGDNIKTFRWLRSQAIDLDHITNVAGLFVEAEIAALPGGFFSFFEYGFSAVVLMVHDRVAETPIDFIAWTKPRRVHRYFGYADALGVDQLYNPTSYFDDGGRARLDGRQIHSAPTVARRRQGASAEGIDLVPPITMRQRKKTKSELTGAQARRSAHAATQAKRPRHA
jgi:hypothetical protein